MFPILLTSITLSFFASSAFADIELPNARLAGCPFIHEDKHNIAPVLENLKTMIDAKIQGRRSCLNALSGIHSGLSALSEFTRSMDPVMKQRLAKDVYQNTLKALTEKKLQLEMSGKENSAEYSTLMGQIQSVEFSDFMNTLDMRQNEGTYTARNEAEYRNHLARYSSSVLSAYQSLAHSNPDCIDAVGGWDAVLNSVIGGVSLVSGMGVSPNAQLISASTALGLQFINLLKDSKIRSAYQLLVRNENSKTLACTYYALKRSECEYMRAVRVGNDAPRMKEFLRNRFKTGYQGEYDRYSVNLGRISSISEVMQVIAQMGSPLTISLSVLSEYLDAKAVDFKAVGIPPDVNSPDHVISGWLMRARTNGIDFRDHNMDGPVSLRERLRLASEDIERKKAAIIAAEQLIRDNPSFMDLKRRLSAISPNVLRDLKEMDQYLATVESSRLIPEIHLENLVEARNLITKVTAFMNVSVAHLGRPVADYEDRIIKAGTDVFDQLARGAVAQLSRQSVVALASRGEDRMHWAFMVIRNAYLDRDVTARLPERDQFRRYIMANDVLSDVQANYMSFVGPGATFRDTDFVTGARAFEKSFKNEMLSSIEYTMSIGDHATAANLCALYVPSLQALARDRLLGGNRAAKVLKTCMKSYKTLQQNRLVEDRDYAINYGDQCTYPNYIRDFEIQNVLSRLARP